MNIKEAIIKTWKNRKLVFDILTIFMLIMTVSITLIITISYRKNYASIVAFSEMTIQKSAQRVLEKFSCIINEFERIPEISSAAIQHIDDVSINNRSLLDIMEQQIKTYPKLAACYLSTIQGKMLAIFNAHLLEQKTLLSDPNTPIPENTLYSLWIVDQSVNPPHELHLYLDKDFKELHRELISPSIYDPRFRLWYQAAEKNRVTSWTDIYKYYPTGITGITVATPILDAQKNFIGVSAADLVLTSLSEFLLDQKIGKTGKAFIVDPINGEVLLPLDFSGKPVISNIPIAIVYEAFSEKQILKKEGFILKKENNHLLCGFENLPLGSDKNWLIAVIAPLNDFVYSLLSAQYQIIIISLIIFIIAAVCIIIFAKKISGPIEILASQIDNITQLNLDHAITVTSNIYEVNIMNSSITALRNAIKSFARYLPKEMVRQLIKKGQEITIGGEKKELVIMFSDIKGFTGFAETLPVDVLVNTLTEHFDALSDVIIETQGTIDKYIGDSIMAFWGAPNPLPYPRMNACLAALRCTVIQKKLADNHPNKLNPPFMAKFGIDAGIAIVGNIGAQQRINYTAIGDAVNTAARLQALNNTYQTTIIISDNVYQMVKDNFLTRPLDIVLLKGRHTNTKIYELIGENSADASIGATEEQELFCDQFRTAFEAFETGHQKRALDHLYAFLEKHPNDEPTKLLIKKITQTAAIND